MKRKYLELNRDDYVNALRENIYVVVFEKVNGDLREMICTLKSEALPKKEEDEAIEKVQRAQSTNSVAVYDLQANGWRSFRINSVIVFKKFTGRLVEQTK